MVDRTLMHRRDFGEDGEFQDDGDGRWKAFIFAPLPDGTVDGRPLLWRLYVIDSEASEGWSCADVYPTPEAAWVVVKELILEGPDG